MGFGRWPPSRTGLSAHLSQRSRLRALPEPERLDCKRARGRERHPGRRARMSRRPGPVRLRPSDVRTGRAAPLRLRPALARWRRSTGAATGRTEGETETDPSRSGPRSLPRSHREPGRGVLSALLRAGSRGHRGEAEAESVPERERQAAVDQDQEPCIHPGRRSP